MEFLISIAFYVIAIIIAVNVKKAKNGESSGDMKKTFMEYFEEAKKEVFEEAYPTDNAPEVNIVETVVEPFIEPTLDSLVFEIPAYHSTFKDELNIDDEEDSPLQVDRSLSQHNIKDPRSMFSKNKIRDGIIISEILNKPKSLRK